MIYTDRANRVDRINAGKLGKVSRRMVNRNKLTQNEVSNKIIISKQKEGENIREKNKTVFIEKIFETIPLTGEKV